MKIIITTLISLMSFSVYASEVLDIPRNTSITVLNETAVNTQLSGSIVFVISDEVSFPPFEKSPASYGRLICNYENTKINQSINILPVICTDFVVYGDNIRRYYLDNENMVLSGFKHISGNYLEIDQASIMTLNTVE